MQLNKHYLGGRYWIDRKATYRLEINQRGRMLSSANARLIGVALFDNHIAMSVSIAVDECTEQECNVRKRIRDAALQVLYRNENYMKYKKR